MKALFSAGLAFLSICAWAQPYTFTSLSEMEIKGKVKTILYEKYEARLIQDQNEVVISRAPGLSNYTTHYYDPSGLIQKRLICSANQFSGELVLNHIQTYEYENGRLVYSLTGDVHGKRLFPGTKELGYRYEYGSDNVMHVICEDYSCADHSRYTISENEHIIERLTSELDIHTTEKIYFDEYGRRKSALSILYKWNLADFTQWIYSDEKQQKPELSIRSDFRFNSITTCHYVYNEQNDLISERCYKESTDDPKAFSYQYMYDHHSNWVEKKFFGTASQTGYIHRRTFTYWDE